MIDFSLIQESFDLRPSERDLLKSLISRYSLDRLETQDFNPIKGIEKVYEEWDYGVPYEERIKITVMEDVLLPAYIKRYHPELLPILLSIGISDIGDDGEYLLYVEPKYEEKVRSYLSDHNFILRMDD